MRNQPEQQQVSRPWNGQRNDRRINGRDQKQPRDTEADSPVGDKLVVRCGREIIHTEDWTLFFRPAP
jgi:hypothetical protein